MKKPKGLKINKIWFAFSVVKVSYMFFALFVYAQLTTLGDTDRYLAGITYGSSTWFLNSTQMMDFLAHTLFLILGPVLANLPFVVLSIYGIYYAVQRLELNNKELIFLLAFLSLPSFGVWTSVASKEAMAVFFLGIILGFIIDVIKGNTKKNYTLVIFAFYLCALFKTQYLIGITALLIYVVLSKQLGLKAFGKLILLLLFFLFSFLMLYIFRTEINELSFVMPAHFNLNAGSTRDNTIWVNDYDVFWNAPYGMFVAFFGPTLDEALSKTTHLFAFIESLVILMVFLYALMKLLLVSLASGKLNIYFVGIFLTVTPWILFVHYPFGVLNPGSAIRYRSGFYAFIVILFYFVYLEIVVRKKYR